MKRSQKRFIVLSLLSLILVVGFTISYFHILHDKFRDEIYQYLEEVSAKDAEIIKTKIEDEMKTLKILATYIAGDALQNEEEVLADLDRITEKGNFKQLAVADRKGQCHTNNGQVVDISKTSYFKSAMKGNIEISGTLIDQQDHKAINVYSTPVYEDDKIQGVLLGVQDTSTITGMVMSMKLYEDSFTAVTDDHGSIVLNSEVEQVKNHEQGKDRQYIDVKNHKEDVVIYDSKSRGIPYLISTAPLGINDWYIVSFVPASYADQRSRDFNMLATIAICFITAVIIMLLLFAMHDRRKKRIEKEHLLFYDDVSKGYNFNWYQIHVEEAREKMKGTVWQLVFNVSGFRLLNHMYGYPTGDHMLEIISRELQSHEWLVCGVRKMNDCFIGICEENDIDQLKQKIIGLLQDIQKTLENECRVRDAGILVGIAQYPIGENLFTVIDKANYAMKCGSLSDCITQYQPQMDASLLEEKELEAKMEKALINKEFKVYLQPKVDSVTGRIVAAEALVRWQDPKRGLISPGRFIPLFEKNGFLEQVDFYTCGIVCGYLKKWQDQGFKDISVSFNISPTYIFKEGFVEKLKNTIMKSDIDPLQLEAEITETAFSDNAELLVSIINDIHAMGVRIAMDDFGSGYSSLNMLKEIPVDTLKVDQAFFVQQEVYREKSEQIVSLIMEMANRLHMDIVVEGIETKTQLAAVRECGRSIVQGFYFYKPMPIEEFEKLLWQERNL